LLANCTADAVHAAVLDAKLARLPGIYYNVRRLRIGSPPIATAPSITVPGKKVASPRPMARVKVKPGSLFDTELVCELKAMGFDAVLDPTISGDVALPAGIGVRIITTADAEYWEADDTRAELPGVERPVLAMWQEPGTGTGMVAELEARIKAPGLEVLSFTNTTSLAGMLIVILRRPHAA
jgi:hypothetical protein